MTDTEREPPDGEYRLKIRRGRQRVVRPADGAVWNATTGEWTTAPSGPWSFTVPTEIVVTGLDATEAAGRVAVLLETLRENGRIDDFVTGPAREQ